MNTSVEQLITYFTPHNYEIYFDFSQLYSTTDYKGTVVITGTKINANYIKLHASELLIESITINDNAVEFNHDSDTVTISSDATGEISLSIRFSGTITDAMHGLYPCYFKHDNHDKKLFATQFESHHAREAFPCIDEPAAKATFDLSYKTVDDVIALSNMPKLREERETDTTTHYFEQTPKMSTYLLALVFGELQSVSQPSKNGVDVSIYSTPVHDQADLQFALDSAVKSLDFFEDYFSTPYPLPKCDHIALPDFSSGAMENWGLITYRESCLIASSDAAISTKELVATVIAHETSHQWFGNLVTMKWWDELWLNESFANMMEYVAVDAIYPEWNIWNEYVSHEVIAALKRDQLQGVQAVHCNVNHPDEISTLFDPSIVYAKGSRLIKMLRHYVGEDAWRKGLSNYFKEYAYKNTSAEDLWDALGRASQKDVSSFMAQWLEMPGYPVVSVTTKDNSYNLTQERFLLGQALEDKTLWSIPLASSAQTEPIIFRDKQASFASSDVLLPLNSNDSGHYIVDYDTLARNEILGKLSRGELSVIDRLLYLHEQILLSKSLRIDSADLLSLIERYRDETEEPVWGMIAGTIADIKRFVEDDDEAETALKRLVVSLVTPLYEKLGLRTQTSDTDSDSKLRALVQSLLVYAEYQPYIDEALMWYRETTSLDSLPAEIRPVILGVVSRHGTEAEFQLLINAHDSTNDPELRDDLASSLCMTKRTAHISQLLDRMTDKTVVRPQDTARWYINLLRNKEARQETWQWLEENWSWILTTFRGDKSYDSFARYSATILAGSRWLSKYEAFFIPKQDDPALSRTISIGLNELTTRTEWIEAHKQSVISSLKQ